MKIKWKNVEICMNNEKYIKMLCNYAITKLHN